MCWRSSTQARQSINSAILSVCTITCQRGEETQTRRHARTEGNADTQKRMWFDSPGSGVRLLWGGIPGQLANFIKICSTQFNVADSCQGGGLSML